ncbi:MAG: LamG domain-containing protein [Nitrososphaerota archaeon]|nr:LamG domain-containing protein [Nitrososphaerota archaeon]
MAQKNFTVKVLALCLLTVTFLSPLFLTSTTAQNSGTKVVGEWPMDQIKPSDAGTITPDSTGVNHGILAGEIEPVLVDGKYDKALEFNGENTVYVPIKFIVGFPPMPQPMYVPISQNLDIQKYVHISAWIYVPSLKDATYNNIVIKCTHPDQACDWQNTLRVLGLAIRAGTPENNERYVEGALSGYVMTDSDGFNEIVTTQPVPFNQWVNVEFRRDTTGMHLYLNGNEQTTNVIHGVQNPSGNILNGTEYYFGHDSFATIDHIKITDLSPPENITENTFDIGPNIMIAIIAVALIFATAWLLRRAIQLWIIRPKI